MIVKKPRRMIELEILRQFGPQHHVAALLGVHADPADAESAYDEESSDSPKTCSSSERIPTLLIAYGHLTIFFFSFPCPNEVCRYAPDREPTNIAEVQLLASHLSRAVLFLHEAGFVHADIKRNNLRFTGTEAVLIDFDCAAHWRKGDPPLHGARGTWRWLAPEVRRDKPWDYAVDYWGVGLVTFDVLVHVFKVWARGAEFFYYYYSCCILLITNLILHDS